MSTNNDNPIIEGMKPEFNGTLCSIPTMDEAVALCTQDFQLRSLIYGLNQVKEKYNRECKKSHPDVYFYIALIFERYNKNEIQGENLENGIQGESEYGYNFRGVSVLGLPEPDKSYIPFIPHYEYIEYISFADFNATEKIPPYIPDPVKDKVFPHTEDCHRGDIKTITIEFAGIDSFNRPVFKDVDTGTFYGNTDLLFALDTPEEYVIREFAQHFPVKGIQELVYFGSTFDCEPMGTPVKGIHFILKRK